MTTTAKAPRDGGVTVGGIPWLARMIDKARLDAANEIEPFDLEYPCPMDQGLLRQLGVDAKVFQDIAVNAKDDDTILTQLKDLGVKV